MQDANHGRHELRLSDDELVLCARRVDLPTGLAEGGTLLCPLVLVPGAGFAFGEQLGGAGHVFLFEAQDRLHEEDERGAQVVVGRVALLELLLGAVNVVVDEQAGGSHGLLEVGNVALTLGLGVDAVGGLAAGEPGREGHGDVMVRTSACVAYQQTVDLGEWWLRREKTSVENRQPTQRNNVNLVKRKANPDQLQKRRHKM